MAFFSNHRLPQYDRPVWRNVRNLQRPTPRRTTAALQRAFFAPSLVTLKIVAAIHWEAFRLWLKGVRLVPRPNDAGANGTPDTVLASPDRNDYTRSTLPVVGRKPELRERALVQ